MNNTQRGAMSTATMIWILIVLALVLGGAYYYSKTSSPSVEDVMEQHEDAMMEDTDHEEVMMDEGESMTEENTVHEGDVMMEEGDAMMYGEGEAK